ncbi:hypothetical protein OKW41_005676 [Paraburkholderia sp. UCT70]|uniref:hypothetical protein n=1 Tax=Paraburkholderia sp. UCT70 TaxID=2991068 RepID=UPI003D1BB744
MRVLVRIYCFVALLFNAPSVFAGGDDALSARSSHSDTHVLKLYDARGRLIGPLVSSEFHTGVTLWLNGAVVFAGITRVASFNPVSASASQFQWFASQTCPDPSCSNPPIVSCYPELCPVRPSIAVRQGDDVTLFIAPDTYSNAQTGAGEPAWTPEFGYDLTQHYPEPLSVR